MIQNISSWRKKWVIKISKQNEKEVKCQWITSAKSFLSPLNSTILLNPLLLCQVTWSLKHVLQETTLRKCYKRVASWLLLVLLWFCSYWNSQAPSVLLEWNICYFMMNHVVVEVADRNKLFLFLLLIYKSRAVTFHIHWCQQHVFLSKSKKLICKRSYF